jgi:hypothetical protein
MVVATVSAGGKPLVDLLRHHHPKNAELALYGLVQHDDPTLRHRTGQANFVGQPFMAEAQSVGNDLDAEIMSRAG